MRWAIVAVAFWLPCGLAAAEDKPKTAPAERSASLDGPAQELARQRQALAEQIKRLSASSKEADSAKESDENSAETLRLMRSLDALYAQQQILHVERGQLETQRRKVDDDLAALDEFEPDEPKPYSFLLLEDLKDQLAVERERKSAIELELKAAERSLKAAHRELDSREQERTSPAKGQKKTVDEAPSPDAATAEELAVSIARARIGVLRSEIERHKLRLAVCEARQELLAQQVKVIKKDVAFTARDLERQLQRLAGVEAELRRYRRTAEEGLQEIEPDSTRNPADAAAGLRSAAREALHAQIVVADRRLEDLSSIRRFWQHRYELASDKVDARQAARWLDETKEFSDQLKSSLQLLEGTRESLPSASSASPSSSDEASPEVEKWQEVHATSTRQLRDLIQASVLDAKATLRMLDRFGEELKPHAEETESTWGASVPAVLKTITGYEIADVDDQSITVGQVLVLLAYILGGILLAYLVSRVVGRRLLPQLGIQQGTIAALRSMLFYTLCVVFGILSFQVLHIPLAAFAFLGGAAAIAIGFGGQDIMNNFMSGIILLTEQPIRAGDVVQIGKVQGIVLHIGLRSTRLQTDANHELIVPNKSLLDEQVTNLTLSDNIVQLFITFGLDRAVNVTEAKWKMLEIAFAHPLVLKSPRPVVLVKEFDPYWTTFEVHFWTQHQSFIKCASVQSEVLEGISNLYPGEDEKGGSAAAEEAPAKDAPVDGNKPNGAALIRQLKHARSLRS